jgi:hypothetical protein
MNKGELLEKVKKGDYTKEKLEAWISCLPGSLATRKPTKNKVGDVYMHPIFMHPYVLLNFRNGVWVCGLLTSESKCPEILVNCDSRFFENSYITKTLFTASEIVGTFINVYDNPKQIKQVLTELKKELIY